MKIEEFSQADSIRRERAIEIAQAYTRRDDDKQAQVQKDAAAERDRLLEAFAQFLSTLFPPGGAPGATAPSTATAPGADKAADVRPPSAAGPVGAGPSTPAAPGNAVDAHRPSAGGQSSYGPGSSKAIMSEAQRDARYYEGAKPGAKDFYGSSTNTKSKVVADDIMRSVKDNWNEVDPDIRKGFESGKFDNFWPDDKKPPGFDKMEGWKKAALFELGKASFETAGTFDPNHKDPGGQAWGAFSLYNKDPSFKNYGLKGDLCGADNKAALTSPGYGVIADLNTLKESFKLQQSGNSFGHDNWLDRAHMTFVDVNKGMDEYQRQKDMIMDTTFGGAAQVKQRLGADSLFDLVSKFE
jgi:hypothetical protein